MRSWVRPIAKKWYSMRRPSAILNLWISEFLSRFRHRPSAVLNLGISEIFSCFRGSAAWVKICVCVPNFVIIGRFAAEIWRYNYFQNGGRPPCWIYCDVIILYRKTEFNALDIVLNFDVHRFRTFWYTSTIMFHHFSLKLPIFALTGCVWAATVRPQRDCG